MGTIYRNGVAFIGGGSGGGSASQISYDNTTSQIPSTNVQGAIDDNRVEIDALKAGQGLFNLIYPVGSIYMSVNNTNPSSFFGGTWVAWGSGRVPVGVDANVTDFNTVEKTGGASSVTLTAAQSGVPAHAHGLNNHTHKVWAHSHGLNGHAHSIPELSGTAKSNGSHSHAMYLFNSNSEAAGYGLTQTGGFQNRVKIAVGSGNGNSTQNTGAHTHTVTTGASVTGGNSGSTANSAEFNSGQSSGNTANNTAANASAAHTNLQPYITCYMWKRTA